MNSLSEIDESRRKFLIYLLSTGAFSVIPGCSTGGTVSSRSLPVALPAGKSIYQFKGKVTVNSKPVTLATMIAPGDEIETFDNSYIIFVVNKDAFILRSNSLLQLPVLSATTSAFELKQGKVLSVLATRRTQIKTPSAFINIRGTGIYLESEPDRSYVCTCYGKADLSTPDNPGINESITSTHHSNPRYILADTSLSNRIQPAPFKDHDDQELLLIETLVGRTTPYVVPQGINRVRIRY
jgi:hypothetical protein